MSIHKGHFEAENFTADTKRKNTGSSNAKQRKNSYVPSTFVWESPENMPLPKLVKLIWLRLRRSWIAFRFQSDRWTFGMLNRKTMIQLAVFAGAAVYFLGPENRSALLSSAAGSDAEFVSETTFEVGTEEQRKKPVKKAKPKSDAAPVAADDLLKQQSLNYIEQFAPVAIGEMKKFGIPASISLAQGLIESRAGTSKLAVNNNNHFGMKCFARNCKKGHCTNFTDDSHKDFFRKFPTPWESWRAHSQLLASGRYVRLKKYGRDYRAWANGLQSVGYATDRTYANKLIGIIERYDLHRYDR